MDIAIQPFVMLTKTHVLSTKIVHWNQTNTPPQWVKMGIEAVEMDVSASSLPLRWGWDISANKLLEINKQMDI